MNFLQKKKKKKQNKIEKGNETETMAFCTDQEH